MPAAGGYDDMIVAEGDTFENRENLKRLGFAWNGVEKHWYRWERDEDIDELFERVGEECDGITLRIEVRS